MKFDLFTKGDKVSFDTPVVMKLKDKTGKIWYAGAAKLHTDGKKTSISGYKISVSLVQTRSEIIGIGEFPVLSDLISVNDAKEYAGKEVLFIYSGSDCLSGKLSVKGEKLINNDHKDLDLTPIAFVLL